MPTNTYTELRRTVVGTATPFVTLDLTGISGYSDLVIVMDASASTYVNSYLRFNGDAAGNTYSATRLYGNGSSATSAQYSTETFSYIGDLHTTRGVTTLHIQDYANTTTFKSFISRDNAAGGGLGIIVGMWRKSTLEAITSIEIGATAGANLTVGSTISVYGIKSWTDESTPKATGGYVTSDSTYWYHAFPYSSAFVPNQSLTADILVVAGGGSGGGYVGGGGGAGGLLHFSSQSLTATTYNCVVGGGGARSTSASYIGKIGNDSQFGALTLVKGGGAGATGGGQDDATVVRNGGSGGGGGSGAQTAGGSPTTGQGFAGGASAGPTGNYGSGGGGGAGAAGSNGGSVGGNGGNGVSTYSSYGTATGYGQNISETYWFAGGGGGGVGGSNSAGRGLGGNGGGGSGSVHDGLGSVIVAGTDGLQSTGGGSGSGNLGASTTRLGTRGGSGIIIVRYTKA